MDRGAGQAAGHGVAESDTAEATEHTGLLVIRGNENKGNYFTSGIYFPMNILMRF